mmetsp:Transcript_30021/g.80642  ORF Transcript_30021/g.80642 Transcript_30021/m.80642 type:complete len:203 (+) Transcript_30021:1121-1729(+)
MQVVRNLLAENKGEHVAQVLRRVLGQADEVVLAHGHHLQGEGVLVAVHARVRVLCNHLLGRFVAQWGDGLQERDELLRVVALRVVKVDAIAHLCDGCGICMCAMAEDELLQPEDGALVGHLLADLHHGHPVVLGLNALTLLALAVGHNELNHEGLLEHGAADDLLLHGELELDALGVSLGPDEGRVHKAYLVKATHALEKNG